MMKIGTSLSKIFGTFVISILVIILCFAFYPKGILIAQDMSEMVSDHLRDVKWIDDEAKILLRFLTEGGVILGVLTTLISRILLELLLLPFSRTK